MLIGSWNITNANAKQFNVTFGYHAVTSRSEWVPGASTPVLLGDRIGWKSLQIVLVVKGNGRDAIRANVSKILGKLLEPVTITLDGITNKFKGYLRNHTEAETAKNRWHTLTLDLDGYEFGAQVSASGSSSISVSNPGTLPSPAVVTITPSAGMASLKISGLGGDMTFTDVVSGQPIVVNGETGIITQNGALKDADFYTLPVVQPGNSTITCNRAQATVAITFYPRYM